MLLIKKTVFVTAICLSIAACDQSGDNEKQAEQTSTTTNVAETTTNVGETPLAIPDTSTQAPSTSLHDIWVLDSINNIAPDSNYFAHGTPYFDLNLDKKSITGHTGCNALSGKLNVEGANISFKNLVIAKEACNDKDFEEKLLSGFRSGNTTYTIVNGRLHLNAGPDFSVVFRRIRR